MATWTVILRAPIGRPDQIELVHVFREGGSEALMQLGPDQVSRRVEAETSFEAVRDAIETELRARSRTEARRITGH